MSRTSISGDSEAGPMVATILGFVCGQQRDVHDANIVFPVPRRSCSAMDIAPSAESLIVVPDANAPPPVEIWMMPSALLSVSPRRTALAVVSDVTLTAGRAKPAARARSSIVQ